MIPLSQFIENWDNSKLLNDIQKFATHITIPKEIRSRKKIDLRYRTGFLLLYYVFCFSLILLPAAISDLISPNYQASLDLAGLGLFSGIIIGMINLWEYNIWLNLQPSLEDVKKISKIYYLTPLSGWILALLIGILYQTLANVYPLYNIEGLIRLIVLVIGASQFKILTTVYQHLEKEIIE